MRTRYLVIAWVILFTCGCSTLGNNTANNEPSDPLEPINRTVWDFNWNYVDKYAIKPAAEFYVGYINEDIRDGLLNVAENLNEPASIINNLLQGKFTGAVHSTGRFIVNSTVGVFGIFDVANHLNLTKQEESFSEVLGSYGVNNGPYLMLPVAGPSSVREEVGNAVDRYYWPLAALEFWPNLLRLSILGLEQRAALIEQEALLEQSVDSYEFVKSVYFQNEKFKLYDGNLPLEVNEEVEAELDLYLEEVDDIED